MESAGGGSGGGSRGGGAWVAASTIGAWDSRSVDWVIALCLFVFVFCVFNFCNKSGFHSLFSDYVENQAYYCLPRQKGACLPH